MPKKSRLNLPPLKIGKETLGQRLARVRKEKGYTQKELAKKTGLIQNLISAYERDRLRLTAEMAIRFAKALKVNIDELLSFKNDQISDPQYAALWRKLKKAERLPKSDQKALIHYLNALLVKNKVK